MNSADRPILRLKPKADARRIRHGHPWAWTDELVLDRRSKAVPEGAIAVLEDAGREPLGTGVASVGGRIGFRLLDPNPAQAIDADWLRAQMAAALDLRARLYETPHYRLIHAEGDGLPGLIVDRFGDVLVMQPNLPWLDARTDILADLLQDVTGASVVIKNGASRAREAEGLAGGITVLHGTAPGAPVEVPMNGARYLADVMGGQKTGLFFDQRENQASVARMAKGARVLDLFSHVGGFGLAALANGAKDVICIDAAESALALAADAASRMGHALETRRADAFDAMTALAAEGQVFDIVVADPPAFAPAKSALTQALRAYERVARLAAPLVSPGGILVLCSCSHAAELSKFRNACLRGIGRAGRRPVLLRTGFAGPDHPQHTALSETGYLKALTFRLAP